MQPTKNDFRRRYTAEASPADKVRKEVPDDEFTFVLNVTQRLIVPPSLQSILSLEPKVHSGTLQLPKNSTDAVASFCTIDSSEKFPLGFQINGLANQLQVRDLSRVSHVQCNSRVQIFRQMGRTSKMVGMLMVSLHFDVSI